MNLTHQKKFCLCRTLQIITHHQEKKARDKLSLAKSNLLLSFGTTKYEIERHRKYCTSVSLRQKARKKWTRICNHINLSENVSWYSLVLIKYIVQLNMEYQWESTRGETVFSFPTWTLLYLYITRSQRQSLILRASDKEFFTEKKQTESKDKFEDNNM